MLRRFLSPHIQHDEYKGQQAGAGRERERGLLALHFILWLKGAKIK